jgi:hypothetical protein
MKCHTCRKEITGSNVWAVCENPPRAWCSERCTLMERIEILTPEKEREIDIQLAWDNLPMPTEKIQ